MKLYLPHAFTLDDGKEAVHHAAGTIRDFEKGIAEMLKKRFGAVPASEAPQDDPAAKASITPTPVPPATPPAPATQPINPPTA